MSKSTIRMIFDRVRKQQKAIDQLKHELHTCELKLIRMSNELNYVDLSKNGESSRIYEEVTPQFELFLRNSGFTVTRGFDQAKFYATSGDLREEKRLLKNKIAKLEEEQLSTMMNELVSAVPNFNLDTLRKRCVRLSGELSLRDDDLSGYELFEILVSNNTPRHPLSYE